MPLKQFLIILAVAGAASWLGFFVVILGIDPETSGVLGITLLYATLGCGLFVVLVLMGLAIRMLRGRMQQQSALAFKLIGSTVRQALWCTVITLISLLLAAHDLFNIWSGLALVAFFSLLEGFLYSLKRPTTTLPITDEPIHELSS